MKTRSSMRYLVFVPLVIAGGAFLAARGVAQEPAAGPGRGDDVLREESPDANIPSDSEDRGIESRREPSRDFPPPRPGRPGGPWTPEQIVHAQHALMHLQAAGLDREARRLEALLMPHLQRPGQPGVRGEAGPPSDMGPRPEFGPWGQAAQMQMEQLRQAIGGLRASVEQLEQRTRQSDDVARAVDEAHRKIQNWQREAEERGEALEKTMRVRMKELEQSLNGQWKEQRQDMLEAMRKQLELAKQAVADRRREKRSDRERADERRRDDGDHERDDDEDEDDDDDDEDEDEHEHEPGDQE